MPACARCGNAYPDDSARCPNCNYSPSPQALQAPASPAAPPSGRYVGAEAGFWWSLLLKVFGWLSLVLGLVGGIAWFAEFGVIETPGYLYSTVQETNPLGVAFAFGIALQGIVICVVFNALAVVIEHLIALRHGQVVVRPRVAIATPLRGDGVPASSIVGHCAECGIPLTSRAAQRLSGHLWCEEHFNQRVG